MKVPFVSLNTINKGIMRQYFDAVQQITEEGSFVGGPEVQLFERKFADYCGTAYCAGVNSGLDALKLALKTVGIGPGDEVIVPANTFIATWVAVSDLGAVPVAVDADISSGNIDTKLITSAISNRTKAIIPVHLYGTPCEMDEILNLAGNNNLLVVEDNAQAQGATYKGRLTGSFGHANATSFYPSKNLGGAGDGGAITTNDHQVFEKICQLRNYGSSKKYVHETIGFNSRLDTLQAAFLLLKLGQLDKMNAERKNAAQIYRAILKDCAEIELFEEKSYASSVYHLFTIRTQKRDDLKNFLQKSEIETGIHYPIPCHLQSSYRYLGYSIGSFPVTEKVSKTTLSLPMYNGIADEQIEFVCQKVLEFFKN